MVWVRTQQAIQNVVDQAPKAKQYYSDGFDAYQWLWYHFGRHEISKGKSDTYSVEADNAELRHYLARLARKSRCFSRCPYALECALRLLFLLSTEVHNISNAFQIMLLMLWTSLAHDV